MKLNKKVTNTMAALSIGLFVVVLAVAAVLVIRNHPQATPTGAYGYSNPFVFLYGGPSGTKLFYTDSTTITTGQSIDLYWQAGNVDYCTTGPKPWTGTGGLSSPIITVGPIAQSTTYIVQCYNRLGGSTPVTKSQLQVFVQPGGYGYDTILTATLSPTSPSGYIKAGATSVPLFRFNLSAPRESVALTKMRVEIGGSLPLGSLSNIQLIDDSTQGVLLKFPTAKELLDFNFSGLNLPRASTKSFTIMGDIAKKAPKSTLFVRLNEVYRNTPPTLIATSGLPVVGNLLGILVQ